MAMRRHCLALLMATLWLAGGAFALWRFAAEDAPPGRPAPFSTADAERPDRDSSLPPANGPVDPTVDKPAEDDQTPPAKPDPAKPERRKDTPEKPAKPDQPAVPGRIDVAAGETRQIKAGAGIDGMNIA